MAQGRALLLWAVVLLGLANITGLSAFDLRIAPRQVTVHPGGKTSILCRASVPITKCRFLLPGDRVVDLSRGAASPSTDEYRYYGRGLNNGQCGITLTKLTTQFFSPVACQVRTERQGWRRAAMFLRVTNLATLQWDIDPQQTVVLNPGQNASFLCLTNVPLSTCRFGFMKDDGWLDLSLGPISKRTSEYAYYGTGLEDGQCGITLFSVAEDTSQELRCVGIGENGEWVGDFFSVVVAKQPDVPQLTVSSARYQDGDSLSATCAVNNGRPAPNITWFLGNEVVNDVIVDVSPDDVWFDHELQTVVQILTRRLSCRDNNKMLRCSAGPHLEASQRVAVDCDGPSSGQSPGPPPTRPITPSQATSQPSAGVASPVVPDIRPPTSAPSDSSICGLPVPTNQLIVNGEAAAEGHWPWIAAIFVKKVRQGGLEFQCGGTLISRGLVITAAHCVHRGGATQRPDDFVIFLGKHDLNDWTEPHSQLKRVEKIISHPSFVSVANGSDIAVLALSSPATYTDYIRPICLWNKGVNLADVVGQRGTVVGWGRYGPGAAAVSDTPRVAKTAIVSQEECLRSNPDFVKVTTQSTFCAGSRDGSGPCNGDSGSGFVLPYRLGKRTQWFLRGIVSLALQQPDGDLACDLNEYVVYTDVAKYATWLRQIKDPSSRTVQEPSISTGLTFA